MNLENMVIVDVYLIMTFIPPGSDEIIWSALPDGQWREGLLPVTTGLQIPAGFEYSSLLCSFVLPCASPNISEHGDYILRMAAFESGSLDLISNIAQCSFEVGSLEAE